MMTPVTEILVRRTLNCMVMKRVTRVTGVTVTVLFTAFSVVLLLNFKPYARNSRPPSSDGPVVSQPARATASDTESAGGRGYVVTVTYSGQQGSAIRAIVSQQCWIGSVVNKRYNLQVYSLEPLLVSTKFVAGTIDATTKSALPFEELFDIANLNEAMVRLGLGQMATIEDFFKNAPRKITLLTFTGEGTTSVIWTALNESDCYNKETGKLSSLVKKGFCISKIIQTAYTKSTNMRYKDKEYIFKDHSDHVLFENWDPLQSVLVINHWSAGWFAPVDTVPTNTPLSEHPSDSSRCKFSDLENVHEKLMPSPSLLKSSMMYKKKFLKVTGSEVKIVAVMFRLEQLITTGAACTKTKKDHIDSPKTCISGCVQEAVEITKSLQKQDGFSSRPFLTHDIGLYGSLSFKKKLVNNSFFEENLKTTMLQLFGHDWTLGDLEKSYSEISENKGYIAALQRHIASDADCLVLVGGGNFQDFALHDYIRKHPNVEGRCVHFVCAQREDMMQNALKGGDGL